MSELTEEQQEKLKEIIETWDNAHRAIKFLKWTGAFLKWFAGIGASAIVLWAAFHNGPSK